MKKFSCVTFGILALSGLLGGACGSDDEDDGAGGSGGSAGTGKGGSGGSGTSKGGSSGSGTGGTAGTGTSKGGSAGAGNSSGAAGESGTAGESGAAGEGGSGGHDSGGTSGSGGGDFGGQSGSAGAGGAVLGGEGGVGGEPSAGAAGAEAGGAGGADPLPLPACDEIPSLVLGDPGTFSVSVTGFDFCEPIPAQHTCDEKPFPQGTSPAITWTAGPEGTESYAVVFKDITIIATTPASDPLHNRGFHYVIWDIPPATSSLPAAMAGGHLSTEVVGARQWSNFNDYGFFGPCPNFDPELPTANDDSYSFVVYALPFATATVPAPVTGISTVRNMDDYFKTIALAAVEYRGTSDAHASEIPDGVLPPTAKPPCPSEGEPPADCLEGP